MKSQSLQTLTGEQSNSGHKKFVQKNVIRLFKTYLLKLKMTPEVMAKLNLSEKMRKRYLNKLAMASVFQRVVVIPTDASYPENSNSGSNSASNSGSNSASNSGSNSASNSGSNSASNSGSNSASNSGSNSASNSGSNPASNPGRSLALQGDLTTPQMLTRAFLWYKKLSPSSLAAFKQCKLNLRPAISRCQSTHKGKKCEQLGIGMVQVQCPEGMTRFGSTKCVLPCPAGFTKKSGLYCKKQKAQRIAKDKNCAKGFERVGSNLCVQTCPLGWKDQGKKCLKPHSLKLGAPFLWAKGD